VPRTNKRGVPSFFVCWPENPCRVRGSSAASVWTSPGTVIIFGTSSVIRGRLEVKITVQKSYRLLHRNHTTQRAISATVTLSVGVIDKDARFEFPRRWLAPGCPTRPLALEMSNEPVSPRVNSARIKDFIGAAHPVRFTGKVLNVRSSSPHLALSRFPHLNTL
jgi:hypothetical protein